MPLIALAALSVCAVGAYQGPSRDFVAIVELPDSAKTGAFRYTFEDGRFGTTGDGQVACAGDMVKVGNARWRRIALKETRVNFKSGDAVLAGILIEPPRVGAKPPLIVTVHGSEDTPWIHRQRMPYMMAAQGISVFAFDKRGTGASTGTYNQNFARLAADVVAAAATAKRLAHGRYSRFGLTGGSQGGWVAPRAANAAGAEFVAIGYGLLIDPLEEDAEQVATELRNAGYDADTLAQARHVTDATGAVMTAHFRAGYERLAAVKARYEAEPWFAKIKGEFTGDVLRDSEAELRATGAEKYDNLDIDWGYDAVGELRKVEAPQLWVLADADREAPSAETLARLETVRASGRSIRIVRFSDTDHGIMEFKVNSDGSRAMTRVAEGYFRLVADWIKGQWSPPYGRAQVVMK